MTNNFINLTPHAINVVREDGSILDIPVSGSIARCSQTEEVLRIEEGVKITRQSFGTVEGLPDPTPGTTFVVSRLVASALPDRHDLVCPGPLVRNDEGQPIGCKGLSVVF